MTISTSLRSPFSGGMVTDRPAWEIGPQFSPYAQDGYSPSGDFRQRGGWKYDGTTADAAKNLEGVGRAQLILSDTTRTYVAGHDGSIYIHNAAAAGTSVSTAGAAPTLIRAVYGDHVIACRQDGIGPIVMLSGAATAPASVPAGTNGSANKATVTLATVPTGLVPGAYCLLGPTLSAADCGPFIYPRVVEVTSGTKVVTFEDVRFVSTTVVQTFFPYGFTYPCVNVYDAGTGSFDAATEHFNGDGTKWSSAGIVGSMDAVLAIRPAGRSTVCGLSAVASDTQLTLYATSATDSNINYAILRRCPFKDVASHNGSLWGTGVAQYPSRVYVGPPGWNLTLPPGSEPPLDPGALPSSTNPNDFLMDFVDIPTVYEGDANVAILSSPGPLLVLKRNAVHGVFGSYPQFSQSLIANGVGCIDIRSAQSFAEGQFWAGESGIYWYKGGRITDLTAGRINREWRALTRDFDYGVNDYCALGVEQGYVVVHITTGGGTTRRTYLYDLASQSWQSRVSNFTPRYMFSSRIPGEASKLLSVSDDRQGRVLDFAPAIDGAGTAKDAAGTGPSLEAWTPESIDGQNIDADMRMLDLAVHANVYDAGAAGATTLGVSVVTQDALTEPATATTTLAAINSDTVDRIDRHYYRRVDKRGRRHQVRVAVGQVGTDSAATTVAVSEITATFRSGRDRT